MIFKLSLELRFFLTRRNNGTIYFFFFATKPRDNSGLADIKMSPPASPSVIGSYAFSAG